MNAKEINAKMMAAGIPGYAREWNGRRIYINLDALDRSFAGDRNYQLYYDLASKQLVSKAGKGTLTSEFIAAVNQVQQLF